MTISVRAMSMAGLLALSGCIGAPVGYGPPGYAQPVYAQPGYAQPGYAQPGYAQPGNAQPGYAPSGGYSQAPEPQQGYAPMQQEVAYGATCYAGVYTCALTQSLPVGAPCSCPGLGAPSYGNVR